MMFEPYSMYLQYYIGTVKRQAKSCDPKTELAVQNMMLLLLREKALWFKVLIKGLLCNGLSIKVKAKGSSSLKLGRQ